MEVEFCEVLRPLHLRLTRNNKKSSVRPFLLRNWVPTPCARPGGGGSRSVA